MTTRTFTFTVASALSPLETAAGNLSSNTWTTFATTLPTYGDAPTFASPGQYGFFVEPGNPGVPGSILDYSQVGYYDRTRRKVFHIGAAYNGRCFLATYNEPTNAWSRTTLAADITHSWDQFSYDSLRGIGYIFNEHGTLAWSVNISTGALAVLTPPYASTSEAASVRYLETADKHIAIRGSDEGMRALVGGGSAWTSMGTAAGSVRGRNGLSAYNHLTDEMYYGGGFSSTALRKVNSTGTVTQLAATGPTMFSTQSWMVPDPQTGLPVVFGTNGQVHAWTGSAWTQLSTTFPAGAYANSRTFGVSLRGISGSVFMFVNAANGVYLYRRS
jgi:hypothetical protein